MRPAAILIVLVTAVAIVSLHAHAQTTASDDSVNAVELETIRQDVADGFVISAVSDYAQLLERDPEWTYCHYNKYHGFEGYLLRLYDMETRPSLYEAGPLPRSREALMVALAEDPENADAMRELGLLFADVEAFFDAIDLFNEALARHPDDAELLVLRTLARLGTMTGGLLITDRARVFAYSDPQDMVTDMSRASDLGADDFLALWADAAAHRQLQYVDSDAEPLAVALARYDAAIAALPAMRQHHLYPLLSYMAHEGRASILFMMNDLDAFDEEITRAVNGADLDTMRDRCPDVYR